MMYLLYFSAWKVEGEKYVLNVYFVARVILSSNSNNCCLLYFNANIMCSFTKLEYLWSRLYGCASWWAANASQPLSGTCTFSNGTVLHGAHVCPQQTVIGRWLGLRHKFFFVTDEQKQDYLSRDLQCARGVTKRHELLAPDPLLGLRP